MSVNRPVNEDGTEATGWFCYYICDKSGMHFNKPNWVNYGSHLLLDTDKGSLEEYILHYLETWALDADRYSLDIFINVTPPIEVVEDECNKLRRLIDNKQAALDLLEHQLYWMKVLTRVQK